MTMTEILYFNYRYHHTGKDDAVYFAEISAQKEILFYVCETDAEPFYRDRVTDVPNKAYLTMYLSVLLKSVMETQH